jgi:hypothetical protein
VDGTPVRVEYPGAPDSTVARFALPRPLPPGDSVVVRFAWEARPSTVPRRQGRRGRQWDFAQWYPKVAVYDRGGWQANALRPAGEFYGEFGDFDVSLTLAGDQVVGATGVPVEGDPGWERARRWGEARLQRDAYAGTDSSGAAPDAARETGSATPPASGMRTVRFVARGVHHFAWTTSPDFRYEGGVHDGRVAIHVLYRPGDEPSWGSGQAVRRTAFALRWLEELYGRYPYPQVTNVHRIEGGGTEFPMLVMDGSASQGLILHEVGHIYSYGLLANNEWRSGWMDEGLTSYQTGWAQGTTAPERARAGGAMLPAPRAGYAARALRPAASEAGDISQILLDLNGLAEPIGTVGHEFGEFAIYNAMVYGRAERMFGALRDVVGDTAFRAFLRTYYDRWRFRHVDERAMRRAAEDASGRALGWFFEQWVHRTGLIDYALEEAGSRPDGGAWVTRARVVRRGEYRHPVPVGARTADGWVIARADPMRDEQWVELRTATPPEEVRLDPQRVVLDWDRRNDVPGRWPLPRAAAIALDLPFLDQSLRDRAVLALAPIAWYSTPGGLALGLRERFHYLGLVDRGEFGIGVSARVPSTRAARPGGGPVTDEASALTRLQLWWSLENPRLGRRPLVGLRLGAAALDGHAKADVRMRWDASPLRVARGPRRAHALALTVSGADRAWLDPLRWGPWRSAVDAGYEATISHTDPDRPRARLALLGGYAFDALTPGLRNETFGRAEGEWRVQRRFGGERRALGALRLYGAAHLGEPPLQRSVGIASRDGVESFGNHLLRGRGAPLAREDVHYVELGGAGLRGYSPLLRLGDGGRVLAANAETGYVLWRPRSGRPRPEVHAVLFGDAAWLGERREGASALADAGLGVAVRGMLWDRDVRLRLDFPLVVRHPALAVGADAADGRRARFRWMFSFRDLW